MIIKRFTILSLLIAHSLFFFSQNNSIPNESNTNYSLKMEYPMEAQLNEIEGSVIITFDLDATCSIHHIRQDIVLGYGCEDAIFDSLCELELLLKKDFNNTCEPLVDNTIPALFELEKRVSLK